MVQFNVSMPPSRRQHQPLSRQSATGEQKRADIEVPARKLDLTNFVRILTLIKLEEAHLSDTRTARATILRSVSEAAFSLSRSDFIIASIERHRRGCENKPIVHSIRRMAPLR